MKRNFIFIAIYLMLMQIQQIVLAQNNSSVSIQNINFLDQSRNRTIPILIYSEKQHMNTLNQKPLVLINHGYTIKNSEYFFIANKLATQGYIVVSIQHDLETDPQLPITGNLYQRRMPLWERGEQNILFVLNKLKQFNYCNSNKIILIGHSNGGDISMLFAKKHPQLVSSIISLDSLRVAFPKNSHIKILTLRANDTKADEGYCLIKLIKQSLE
jgi:predicted dienelactone hydrolase